MPQLCTVEIYEVRINFQTLHQMFYQFPRVSMCVSGQIADERSCLSISMFPTQVLLLCDYEPLMKATLCLVIIPRASLQCLVLVSSQDLLTAEWCHRLPCAAEL